MAKQGNSFTGAGLDTHEYGELLKEFEQSATREREEEVSLSESKSHSNSHSKSHSNSHSNSLTATLSQQLSNTSA